MKKINVLIFSLMFLLSGCFSFNLGGDTKIDSKEKSPEKIMLANPLNVYRTSTNIVISVKTQNKKGEWVDNKYPFLIPTGWYIVSGAALEE